MAQSKKRAATTVINVWISRFVSFLFDF